MRKLKVGDDRYRIVWREIMRSRESRYDHRLHGVLAVARGLSCYETAAIWGRSPRSVEYWVKRFNDEGLGGLRERGRPGRPAALTWPQLEILRSDIRRGPREMGLDRDAWSGSLLRSYLRDAYEVDLSVRQCQRLLRRLMRG